MAKIAAMCLKTYPDEDDIQRFCDGKIKEPCDVKVYIKGKMYMVDKGFNEEYYKLL